MNGVKAKHFSFRSRLADGLTAQGHGRQTGLYTNTTPPAASTGSPVPTARASPPGSRALAGAAPRRRRGQQPREARSRGGPRSRRPGAAAAGSAPLKAVGPPPALHMEGARSRARFLHSNDTSNAASAVAPPGSAPACPAFPPLHTPRGGGERRQEEGERRVGEGKGEAEISK